MDRPRSSEQRSITAIVNDVVNLVSTRVGDLSAVLDPAAPGFSELRDTVATASCDDLTRIHQAVGSGRLTIAAVDHMAAITSLGLAQHPRLATEPHRLAQSIMATRLSTSDGFHLSIISDAWSATIADAIAAQPDISQDTVAATMSALWDRTDTGGMVAIQRSSACLLASIGTTGYPSQYPYIRNDKSLVGTELDALSANRRSAIIDAYITKRSSSPISHVVMQRVVVPALKNMDDNTVVSCWLSYMANITGRHGPEHMPPCWKPISKRIAKMPQDMRVSCIAKTVEYLSVSSRPNNGELDAMRRVIAVGGHEAMEALDDRAYPWAKHVRMRAAVKMQRQASAGVTELVVPHICDASSVRSISSICAQQPQLLPQLVSGIAAARELPSQWLNLASMYRSGWSSPQRDDRVKASVIAAIRKHYGKNGMPHEHAAACMLGMQDDDIASVCISALEPLPPARLEQGIGSDLDRVMSGAIRRCAVRPDVIASCSSYIAMLCEGRGSASGAPATIQAMLQTVGPSDVDKLVTDAMANSVNQKGSSVSHVHADTISTVLGHHGLGGEVIAMLMTDEVPERSLLRGLIVNPQSSLTWSGKSLDADAVHQAIDVLPEHMRQTAIGLCMRIQVHRDGLSERLLNLSSSILVHVGSDPANSTST